MKAWTGFFILFFVVNFSWAQDSTAVKDSVVIQYPELSALIDSMEAEDQKWRKRMLNKQNGGNDSLSLQHIKSGQTKTDKRHFVQLIEIFKKYGFPNFDMVGERSSHNYWMLVQHQDDNLVFQEKVLESMEQYLDENKVSKTDYAYLRDRVNVNKGQKQVYGTQMMLNPEGTSYTYLPVESPDSLDIRRQEMGLPPIDFYIESMNQRFHGTIKK